MKVIIYYRYLYFCKSRAVSIDICSLPFQSARNLLRERIHNYGLDLGSFFMVGDKPDGTKDIHRVGGKDILLDTGKYTDSKVMPDFPVENHTSAVQWIIGCMEK
jgi:hypothetical protein